MYGVIGYGTADGHDLAYQKFGATGQDIPRLFKDDFKSGDFHGQLLAGTIGVEMEAGLALYARLVGFLSMPEDIFGDLMGGSGTGTLAALLMERNVVYVDNDAEKVLLYSFKI